MNRFQLYEKTPAEKFEDAHLLGNGALGASVYGGVPYEKLLINHDTLWSGQEQLKVHPGTRAHFNEARELILDGRLKEANNLINDEMLGYWSECYLPLGELHVTLGQTDDWRSMKLRKVLQNDMPYENYSRILSLNDAIERIEYDQGGVHYLRECFVSHPDDVVALRLSATGGKFGFALAIDSKLRYETRIDGASVAIAGRAPDRTEPYDPITEPKVGYLEDAVSDSIRFAAFAEVVETDGQLLRSPYRLYVQDASYAVILLSAGTNYAGYQVRRDRDAAKVLARCEGTVRKAAARGWEAIRAAHVEDYQRLFNRVDVDFGESVTGLAPTSMRLSFASTSIDDPDVSALALQVTRYLTIAASRPGSQAMNLQGIWNADIVPPWASNYTTNINVQMNYWATEVLNLSECHEPKIDLVRELADSGREAANALYGMEGWVTHHNTDLFRMATIAGEDAAWCWWPFGGVWMAQHLWQHWLYTGDEAFLRQTVYPVLRGAVQFVLDYLAEDRDGYLVTPPSTSPENKFLLPGYSFSQLLGEVSPGNRFSPNQEQVCAVCRASTMDLALTRELFGNFAQAVGKLGLSDELVAKAQVALTKLYPFQIGRHGQLQEWDQDFEECTPGMGHMSHLVTVYPTAVITARNNPALFAAAEKSFQRRRQHGGLKHAWPGAWALCLAARFRDAEACAEITNSVAGHMAASGLMEGMKQIDAIMGWGAGIAEMLLQSHDGAIELLPALPMLWQRGSIRGMRARGGVTVDIAWEGNRLSEAMLTADRDGVYPVRSGAREVTMKLTAGQPVRLNGALQPQ